MLQEVGHQNRGTFDEGILGFDAFANSKIIPFQSGEDAEVYYRTLSLRIGLECIYALLPHLLRLSRLSTNWCMKSSRQF